MQVLLCVYVRMCNLLHNISHHLDICSYISERSAIECEHACSSTFSLSVTGCDSPSTLLCHVYKVCWQSMLVCLWRNPCSQATLGSGEVGRIGEVVGIVISIPLQG